MRRVRSDAAYGKGLTMSMRSDHLGCTGCDYEGFLVYRSVTLVYHFADGTKVKWSRDIGWCMACNNVRNLEGSPPAVVPMQTELDALIATSASAGYRLKRSFSRLLGAGEDDLRARAAELRGQIRLAEALGNRRRCLTCGSHDTRHFEFNEHGVWTSFAHSCGGHLRLAPDDPDAPESPRFNYRPDTLHLDEDGNRIDAIE